MKLTSKLCARKSYIDYFCGIVLGCGGMHGWVEKNHLGAVSSTHETGVCADEFIGNDIATSLSLCSVCLMCSAHERNIQ